LIIVGMQERNSCFPVCKQGLPPCMLHKYHRMQANTLLKNPENCVSQNAYCDCLQHVYGSWPQKEDTKWTASVVKKIQAKNVGSSPE
jgi:hypothetical protein